MLDALDDEGAAPPEVSVERDRLANARQHRNLHEGVYAVSLTFWRVEEYDIDVGPRRGLGPIRALRQGFKHLFASVDGKGGDGSEAQQAGEGNKRQERARVLIAFGIWVFFFGSWGAETFTSQTCKCGKGFLLMCEHLPSR